MEYQIGQAVIYISSDKAELGFVVEQDVLGYRVVNLNGTHSTHIADDSRPATEAEMLAEAVKHGWELDVFNHLRSKHGIWIAKTDHWFVNGGVDITAHKNLNDFGQECITAHRLITALNLAKQ